MKTQMEYKVTVGKVANKKFRFSSRETDNYKDALLMAASALHNPGVAEVIIAAHKA